MSVILDNPLPSSTGRVCQHPCDSRCRRQTFDQAVNMREVHRFIADSIFVSDKLNAAQRSLRASCEATGRKIAIVGAGPAGLTASFYLALLGHDVTVFDPQARGRRHAALCPAGIPPAKVGSCAARSNSSSGWE